MRRKLLATITWCGLLVLLAGGLLTVASSQEVGASKPDDKVADRQVTTVRVNTEVDSFTPWQELYEDGGGLIGASIVIHEENSGAYSGIGERSGRITLVRANGDHLVTARLEDKGTMYACNPTALYSVQIHRFEMVPASVDLKLENNERIGGTLVLQVDDKEYIFALPETQADVSE